MTPNFIHRLTMTLATKCLLQFFWKKFFLGVLSWGPNEHNQLDKTKQNWEKVQRRLWRPSTNVAVDEEWARERRHRGGVVDYILEAEELVTWTKQAPKARSFYLVQHIYGRLLNYTPNYIPYAIHAKVLFPMNHGEWNKTKRYMDGDQTLTFTARSVKGLACKTNCSCFTVTICAAHLRHSLFAVHYNSKQITQQKWF